MSTRLRAPGRFSKALSTLDGPSIISQLSRYEHQRQVSVCATSELLLAERQGWCALEPQESVYLRAVYETFDSAAVLFWSVDLAWRRYTIAQETLAPVLDLDRIRSLVETYFTAPIHPYSIRGYYLDQGLDHIVEFGHLYNKLAQRRHDEGRSQGWSETLTSGLDTQVMTDMAKKYVRGVRKCSVRVKAIHEKYMSRHFSPPNSQAGSYSSSDNDAPRTTDRRTRNGHPSVTSIGLNAGQESEKKRGKRRRTEGDDGEQDQEIGMIREERKPVGLGQIEHGSGPVRASSPRAERLETHIDQPQEIINSAPFLPTSPSPPISPAFALTADADNVTSRFSHRQSSANGFEQFAASQFPEPLAKPTYLSRVSRSPSTSAHRGLAASAFGDASHRGLPSGIRSMAEKTQSKLAQVRKTSEVQEEQERVQVETVVEPGSLETYRRTSTDPGHNDVTAVHLESREREKTQELAEEDNAPKRRLVATPSGILMPPPPPRSSGSTSSRGVASQHSSGQEPSTLPEPSTVLSSPPRLNPVAAADTDMSDAATIPSSSLEQGEPSTLKSSPDDRSQFPYSAAQQHSRLNPEFPIADDSPVTSSVATPNRATGTTQAVSQLGGDSQSQPTDSETSSSSHPRPFEPVPTDFASSPRALRSASHPTVVLSTSTLSVNNEQSTDSTCFNSIGSISAQSFLTAPSFVSPVKEGRGRGRLGTTRSSATSSMTAERSRALAPPPPPSPTMTMTSPGRVPLRRSSRLSKSPAPLEEEEEVAVATTSSRQQQKQHLQLPKEKKQAKDDNPLVRPVPLKSSSSSSSSSMSSPEPETQQVLFALAPTYDKDDDDEDEDDDEELPPISTQVETEVVEAHRIETARREQDDDDVDDDYEQQQQLTAGAGEAASQESSGLTYLSHDELSRLNNNKIRRKKEGERTTVEDATDENDEDSQAMILDGRFAHSEEENENNDNVIMRDGRFASEEEEEEEEENVGADNDVDEEEEEEEEEGAEEGEEASSGEIRDRARGGGVESARRKMSFGELENRATGEPPAEESLDLHDDDDD